MADLHVLPCEPLGQTVVEKLEQVLELAREGKISSVAIAWVDREGRAHECWSYSPSTGTLVGAIQSLAYRLVKDWCDG